MLDDFPEGAEETSLALASPTHGRACTIICGRV
jgi:hypothetical protein